ncbi:Flp family type IVb pilin [Arthrobacter sp. NPDC057009]|uniref:Flp family type IVb pilin n=1 Tax=Arthrobacter sp. NPDC057009 TaxID=3345996 RepID=UPI00362E2EC3
MLAFFSNAAARVRRDEKGATAVEYGIMVALIAVVIIIAVTALGGSLNEMFESVKCQIEGGTYGVASGAAAGTAPTCTPAP